MPNAGTACSLRQVQTVASPGAASASELSNPVGPVPTYQHCLHVPLSKRLSCHCPPPQRLEHIHRAAAQAIAPALLLLAPRHL